MVCICSKQPSHHLLSSQGLIGRAVYRYIFLFWVLLYLCCQSLNYTRDSHWKGTYCIMAAWVHSLIHIITWWCQPWAEPRHKLDFALPKDSDGDQGEFMLLLGEKLDEDADIRSIFLELEDNVNVWETMVKQRQSHRYLLLDSSIYNQNMKPNDSRTPNCF